MAIGQTAAATDDTRLADELVARVERLPITRFHARTALILGSGTFFDSFDQVMIGVVLAVIVSTFHIGFASAGVMISSANVGMLAGAVLFGLAGERYGRKNAFVWSVALLGLLSLAGAFATNFENLLWIRIVQGLGLGGEIPVSAALFNEFVSARARGRNYYHRYSLLFVTGTFMAPLMGLICLDLFGPETGWRAMFVFGGFALPLAIVAHYWLPESPRWLADKGRLGEAEAVVARMEASALEGGATLAPPAYVYRADVAPTRFGELFQGIYARRTVLTWTLFFCTYYLAHGLTAWLPTLYVRIGGLPPQYALLLALASGAVSPISVILYGFVADRIGRKAGFALGYTIGLAGIAVAIAGIVVFKTTAWPMLFAVAVTIAIGIFLNAGGCYLYTPELFPTRMRAWATATGSASCRLSSLIAPLVIGFLLQAGFGIVSVFLELGAVCLIGLVVALTLGVETRHRQLEEVSP